MVMGVDSSTSISWVEHHYVRQSPTALPTNTWELRDGWRQAGPDIPAEATVLHNRVLHPPRHLQPLRLSLLSALCHWSCLHNHIHGVWREAGQVHYHRRRVQERWLRALCCCCFYVVVVVFLYKYIFQFSLCLDRVWTSWSRLRLCSFIFVL